MSVKKVIKEAYEVLRREEKPCATNKKKKKKKTDQHDNTKGNERNKYN